MVAERWWAGTISPDVRAFVSQVQVLKLILDILGIGRKRAANPA